ncbi:MAG: hypothetical protein ACFFAS_17145 [Promethearchaeota archaeon]
MLLILGDRLSEDDPEIAQTFDISVQEVRNMIMEPWSKGRLKAYIIKGYSVD